MKQAADQIIRKVKGLIATENLKVEQLARKDVGECLDDLY